VRGTKARAAILSFSATRAAGRRCSVNIVVSIYSTNPTEITKAPGYRPRASKRIRLSVLHRRYLLVSCGAVLPYFCAACCSVSADSSSGVNTGVIWMVAPNPRKKGSAIAGIWEGSSMLTTKYPPRAPSIGPKYAASGLRSSFIVSSVYPRLPSVTAAFPSSMETRTVTIKRILPLLSSPASPAD
jgi:hypothetical protein